ncbi:MAG TPA: hypothetical protein VKX49_14195 [Bryobacteraceae bacterium]|nr:hypothetical protein [Bryobacteraceae bacterium]
MLMKKTAVLVAGGLLGALGFGQFAAAQTPAKANQDQVTFAKDVARILEKSCQSCHRPDGIGPMSLLTYQDARPWARAIKQQVAQRNMPPWYIDKTVGIQSFKNDISLSNDEIATLAKWADEGAPMGNPADMPPPLKFDDDSRWHIGKPDIVVTLKTPLLVKGKQSDRWIDVPFKDLGITSPRYIQAVEVKPVKGVKVVHHCETSLIDPDTESRDHLEEYALGKYGDVFPEGTGMLVKPGSTILANMHVHADGEDTTADVAIGLKLFPEGEVPKYVGHAQQLASASELDLRPNEKNQRFDGYTVLTKAAVITSFQPHMHQRGQAQCLELLIPMGGGDRPAFVRKETVSCVDRFHFDWHVVYEYSDDVAPIVPAGTILHSISLYDNTAAHNGNPDPTNWVGWGNRTVDEMGFSWITWHDLTEQQYKEELAKRQALTKKRGTEDGAATQAAVQTQSLN